MSVFKAAEAGSKPAEKTLPEDTQQVCIDLPGEIIRCVVYKPKLEIMLRKHRDVIFDLKLGKNKTYTVQATDSDFYNARDKKLVFAKRHDVVTFKDGERLHLWVSRGFKGSLILKSEGKVMMHVEPNEWDKHRHDDEPKTKAPPIIIALGQSKPQSSPTTPKIPHAEKAPLTPYTTPPAQPATTTLEPDCPVVCVVDGMLKGIPERFLKLIKKGESFIKDIDIKEVTSKDWIGAALGASTYIADNWKWLRAAVEGNRQMGFKLVSAKIHYVRGKIRFYFSGYSNANLVFGRGGFGPGHDRIVTIFAGVGKTASTFKAAAKGVFDSFKGYAVVSFIFGIAGAFSDWCQDIGDSYDLVGTVISVLIKTVVVAVLVSLTVAAIVALIMLAGAATVPIIVVGAITISVAYFIGETINYADKVLGKEITGDENYDKGTAPTIASWLRSSSKNIQGSWQYLMNKFPIDYKELTY